MDIDFSANEKWCVTFALPIVDFLQGALRCDCNVEPGFWKCGRTPFARWNAISAFSGAGRRGSVCFSLDDLVLEAVLPKVFAVSPEFFLGFDSNLKWDAFLELVNLFIGKIRGRFLSQFGMELNFGLPRGLASTQLDVGHIFEGKVFVLPIILLLEHDGNSMQDCRDSKSLIQDKTHEEKKGNRLLLEFCLKMDEKEPGPNPGGLNFTVLPPGEVVFLVSP